MKSKKGFTLIELLAIIVILAIIAVITVPIILNIIEDSQKGAAKDSAYGFKDSLNKFYVSELAKDPHFHLEDGTYTVSELNGSAVLTGTDTYTISLSGTVPTSGTIVIENNDITGGNVQIGDYCINLSNMEVTKGECGDTPIANATPERCFEYEVKKELTVSSVDECVTTLMGVGMFGEGNLEQVNTICNGETIGGIDLSQLLSSIKSAASIDLISQFPNVFESKELDEVEITEYKCGGQVTEYNNEEEIIESYTNGEHMDVIIPNKIDGKDVTSIGLAAFSPLDKATGEMRLDKNIIINSVTIPNSVTTIGRWAFRDNQLTSANIPNGVTSIGDTAFDRNQLTSITIPNSVTSIGEWAFSDNQLTSLELPNSVMDIGHAAFEYNQLTSVTIPSSVTTIGKLAFGYNQLTSVTIPNNVTTIGEWAFRDNQLTSVTIPSSVTTIGGEAFYNNPNLTIYVLGYTSKPDGWSNTWNWNQYPVNWNYQG